MPQCSAKSKRSGLQCRNQAVRGRTTCRMHGGTVAVGIASPSYLHGRYSKHIPSALRERYEATLTDPNALALDSELAVADARIAQLLERLDGAESPEAWRRLADAVDRVQAAKNLGRSIDAPLRDLKVIVAHGCGDASTWSELIAALGERRKLAVAETRRISLAQTMIPKQQATALMGALLEAVRLTIDDRDQLIAIQAAYARLTEWAVP